MIHVNRFEKEGLKHLKITPDDNPVPDPIAAEKEKPMEDPYIQYYYPDDFAICYGCGRLNEHGHQLKSYWEGEECVCRFFPKPYHTGAQNFVYGGLVASLMDCHGAGTAAAARHRQDGKTLGKEPLARFVTASLKIDYLRPVPIDGQIVVRGTADDIKGRKVTVSMTLTVDDEVCARGTLVAVQIPDDYVAKFNQKGSAADTR